MSEQQSAVGQCIVTMSWDEYNQFRMRCPALLADPFTRIVALPLRPPESDDPELIALGHVLCPSKILLRTLSGSMGYVDSLEAYERISLDKFSVFARICQLLGAASLEVEEVREVSADGIVSGSISFNANVARAGTDLKRESSRHIAQSIRAKWKWQAGPGNPAQAQEHAEAQGFSTDPAVAGLIQQRQYTDNQLTEHVLELDISSEARRIIQGTLQAETSLSSLGPGFNAAVASLRRQTDQVILRVAIHFSE
jgi:hypothetical protein